MIIKKLRQLKIFELFNASEIEKLAQMSSIKRLSQDNILFYEGEMPNYFYFLLEGHVKVYKTDLKGHELVIHYFMQATFIAEMASFENKKFPATAIAMRDGVEVLLIDKEKFSKLLQEDAHCSFKLLKSISLKVKQLELVINRNMVYDAMTKVCSFIEENPKYLQKVKNKEIASFLNMAPETLSRILSKLRKLEIIDKQNRILDEEKLQAFLEV